MAAWITVVAPYLPEIIRLARPIFTRTPAQVDDTQSLRLDVVGEQILELQNAATQNADSIQLLATDMQKTIELLQAGAERMEQRLRHAHLLAAVALTVAILATAAALYALAH